MTTKIGSALCALAVAVPALVFVRAGELAPAQPTGKVLVLDNERTLEGDIERLGDQYRVRRSLGELWVQRENVLRLCKDYPEAYAFLCTRANLRDPDEHLRLARWCQQHGLRNEALAEVTEAVRIRPHHAESQRLLRSLQQSAVLSRTGRAARPEEESAAGQSPPPVDTESLSIYVTRIQPMLMNACASCHASGRGGAFKLTRTFEISLTNRKITLQNLTAVLAKVNPDQPLVSPLLTKAVSVHGDMAQPALKSRDAHAYRTLEDWVRTTVENSPQLREQPVQPPGSVPFTASAPEGRGPKPRATLAGFASDRQGRPDNPARSAEDREPIDPFDPLIFNRQMHPQKVEASKQ